MAENRTIYPGANDDASYSSIAFAKEKQYIISFYHVPTGHSVEFPAIIESFSDSHIPSLTEEYGYNRMDPAIVQKYTNRRVDLSFRIINSSLEEARYNEQNSNLLLSMMYPLLDQYNQIIGKPFIRVKALNLVNSPTGHPRGMLCVIKNLQYNLDVTEGIIAPKDSRVKEIYPISLTYQISMEELIESAEPLVEVAPNTYPRYT